MVRFAEQQFKAAIPLDSNHRASRRNRPAARAVIITIEVNQIMDTSATLTAESSPFALERKLPPAPVAFHYTQTDSFVALLRQLGASLLVSTYQANKLLAVRASDQGLSALVRTFDRPMGM